MEIKVVFEDKDFLVIDKPAGVVVNRAKTVKKETIQDWAKKKLNIKYQKSKIEEVDFVRRSGIVHRLDKETSGLLIIAKNTKAFVGLQAQFKARRTRKKYVALVHGEVKPEKGQIELPIARNPFNREKFGVFPGGRKAITGFKVLSFFTFHLSPLTFLELTPLTGRTHQIRVHLKYMGHSIVADEKYAGRKTSRADRLWCPRMFLHASFLGFFHPQTGEWVEFESKLPPDLKKALQGLKRKECLA